MKRYNLTLAATMFCIVTLFSSSSFADSSTTAPQASSCIASAFNAQGNQYYSTMTLTLTNQCGTDIDFNNSTITFQNNNNLNTSFWSANGFSPLSYPSNNLTITSQPSGGGYLSTLMLQFPTSSWVKSILPANGSIQITYGVANDGHVGSANVYLSGGGSTVASGNIQITNSSAKGSDVSQNYATVHILSNGSNISNVQLPWSGSKTVTGLAAGNYTITADNVSGSTSTYQASVQPSNVSVSANQTAKATVSFTANAPTYGQVNIQLQSIPNELGGYTGNPVTQLTNASNGSSAQANLTWGALTPVASLISGGTYSMSTPVINFGNYVCQPAFNPTSLIADTSGSQTAKLSYACTQTPQSQVSFAVTGAPADMSSMVVTLTPNNSAQPVTQTIPLTNGQGTLTASLNTGTVYAVSSASIPGYAMTFSAQPFTVADNAKETISLAAMPTGTPVAINGQLTVCGTQLCNEHGQAVQLKGMSSHGIQWFGLQGSNTETACLTTGSMDALAYTWGASVMRIAMYVQEGGYENNPAGFTAQVGSLIEEATKRGIYAIVDWHILNPGDPNVNLAGAQTFFTAIASKYKSYNNVIYEIANEPNGVSWSSVQSYATKLIPVIRAIDPKAPIIVGTPGWSSLGLSSGGSYQDIVKNPVNFPNIMYAFHFYAASHGQNYLDWVDAASNVLPVFVTEFGTQTYSGDGGNDFVMADKYLKMFASKKIGWAMWNYSSDGQSSAVWNPGTCPNGPWTDSNLKQSGTYIKSRILAN